MKKIIILLTILILVSLIFSGCTDVNNPDILPDKMTIISFTVAPSVIESGGTANISWVVTGSDTNVNIDNGIGSVSISGSRIISPTETTIYKLTATNNTSTKEVTTQIIVTINNQEENNSESTPNIAFSKSIYNYLMVTMADSGLKWSDFTITGEYDDSLLGEYVLAGDIIGNCSGTISITYNPTNSLIGTWSFIISDIKTHTPNIAFSKSYDRLTVTRADNDADWYNFEVSISGLNNVRLNGLPPSLSTGDRISTINNDFILAGDYITISGTGTISIRHSPTNSLIGTWTWS